MNFKTFHSKIMSKWIIGWTARKFIQHARKHNLRDYESEMGYYVGDKVSKDQLSEFIKPDDRTKNQIIRNRREAAWNKEANQKGTRI